MPHTGMTAGLFTALLKARQHARRIGRAGIDVVIDEAIGHGRGVQAGPIRSGSTGD